MFFTPAHKQTDPAKLPCQIRNTAPVKAAEYKPAHNGYPEKEMKTIGDYIKKVNAEEGKVPCYMDRSNHWIGFDFDRTLATYHKWAGPDELGEPIMPMLELLKETHKNTECRIFTARVWPLIYFDPHSLMFTWDERRHNIPEKDQTARIDSALAATRAIRKWCDKHLGFQLAITNVKDIHCVRIYDDIAVQVEPNTGRLLGGNNLCCQ